MENARLYDGLQETSSARKRIREESGEGTTVRHDTRAALGRPLMEVEMLNQILSMNESRSVSRQQTDADGIADEIEQPDLVDRRRTSGPSAPPNRKNQGMLARLASRENTALQPFVARFAVINLIGVALIGAAWAQGFLFKPFQADTSGM